MATGTISIRDTASTSTSGQGGQSLITGTPTPGSVLQYTTPGANGFFIEITGAWTGTLSFEQTVDNGTTWVAIDVFIAGVNTILTSVTGNGIFKGNCANDSIIRVRATAAMTGTATVNISGGSPVDFSHVNLPLAQTSSLNPSFVTDITSSSNLTGNYTLNIATTDVLTFEKTANGREFWALSIDPTVENQTSSVTITQTFTGPHRIESDLSINTRSINYFQAEVVDTAASTITAPSAISIASIQQSGTTLTVVLSSPFDGAMNDWVNISGVTDTRVNYSNACVAMVSIDKLTLTINTANESTIASLSVGPYTSQGTLIRVEQFALANNAYGIRFSGYTDPNNAAYLTRLNSQNFQIGGTIGGSSLNSVNSTFPNYNNAATGQVDLAPNTRVQLILDNDAVAFNDRPVDTSSTYSNRVLRDNVRPPVSSTFQFRFRSIAPTSTLRPWAKIVSAVKSGSTTATITTAAAHGLTTGNYAIITGIADTTNFANMTSAATVTVTGSTTFTIAFGASATATSYGGAVIVVNNLNSSYSTVLPAMQSPVITNVSRNASNQVTITGSTSWTTGQGVLNVGDYANLYGVRDTVAGNDIGVDGVYEVGTLVGSIMVLLPLTDYTGTVRSPTGGAIGSTACGGIIMARQTLRVNNVRVLTYTQQQIQIDGQGQVRFDKALPVSPIQISRTNGNGWYISPDNVTATDQSSATITTTTTSSTITPNNPPLGGVHSVQIAVTAVSGTNPTLDLVMQESNDSGTNWETVYQFPRITSTGFYQSPQLPINGNRIRYVTTIGGTTPSFTRSVIRNQHLFVTPKVFRQLFDRTITLTSLNSTTASLLVDGAQNCQLTINIGAATTPPTLQLQGTEDNGLTYYNIGTALAAVASSTVSLTVNNITAQRIQAVVSVAGTVVTAGYVLIRAFG